MDDAMALEDISIGKVSNFGELQAGLQGERAPLSVSHLLQINERGSFLVSQHVAREIALKCELTFVTMAKAYAGSNPAFDGWIFEMDFMVQIRSNLMIEWKDENKKPASWSPGLLIRFLDPDELKQYDLKDKDAWLIPRRWNQGGYDAIYVSKGLVRFIQVIAAKTHNFKPWYMLQALQAITDGQEPAPKQEAVFLVPKHAMAVFQAPTDPKWEINVGGIVQH